MLVDSKDVRTVGFVGHAKTGKTSLCESLLYDSGITSRLGRVDNDSSLLASDPEELKHKTTVHLSVGHCDWKKRKIHFIDTPGDRNFAGDQILALSVVDAAVVVVSASDGVQVGTQHAWQALDEANQPRAIFINKMDRERANFDSVTAEIQRVLSSKAVPFELPIVRPGGEFVGVVDLLRMVALNFERDGRTVSAGQIPESLCNAAVEARGKLIELIAGTDDRLIEIYLERGDLSRDDFFAALKTALVRRDIVPILCGAATANLGVQPLLDLVVDLFPAPTERPPRSAQDDTDSWVQLSADQKGAPAALVFKTVSADIGKLALARIYSGTVAPDSTLHSSTHHHNERVGQIYTLIGKQREVVPAAVPGEIIALAKLKDTKTGATLSDDKHPVVLPFPELPPPVLNFIVHPKSRGDEEKVVTKLTEITSEDTTLHLDRDPISKELLLGGLGQGHIDIAVERLRRTGVNVELLPPHVPYRETIKRKAANIEGKHKKQSGGRGQYGVCTIDIEPLPRKNGKSANAFEFVNAVFGGAIPRQYIPAVEKGVRERMVKGVIAGFPVIDVKVTLTDGKYHDVDSDNRSFEVAGSKAFQAAFRAANPVLLEPIMDVRVTCPEESLGDVIGDLSGRRGKVLGTDIVGAGVPETMQVIRAQAPLAEILSYAIQLEALTAGRGQFTMTLAGYEEVPRLLAEKIISAATMHPEQDN